MDNEVKLSEYLETCLGLESGDISPEDFTERVNAFFQKLIITDYIQIKQKTILLTKILFALDNFTDAAASSAYLEMRKVFDGLLRYCVNLVDDTNTYGPLFPVYDAVLKYGLYDFILDFCEDDYKRFCLMLSDAINISHIAEIANSAALFDNAAFSEWVDNMTALKDQLTPDLIQGLSFLSAKTSGGADQLLETLSAAAADGSIRELTDVLEAMRDTNDIKQEIDKQMKEAGASDGEIPNFVSDADEE